MPVAAGHRRGHGFWRRLSAAACVRTHFACLNLARPDYLVLKADADYAADLRDRYAEIEPAWHWNKKYWNQIAVNGFLPDEFVKSLIRHSYSEVAKKLKVSFRKQYPQVCEINMDNNG